MSSQTTVICRIIYVFTDTMLVLFNFCCCYILLMRMIFCINLLFFCSNLFFLHTFNVVLKQILLLRNFNRKYAKHKTPKIYIIYLNHSMLRKKKKIHDTTDDCLWVWCGCSEWLYGVILYLYNNGMWKYRLLVDSLECWLYCIKWL